MDNKKTKEEKNKWKHVQNGGMGAVYGLGFVGAVFYFIQHANSFQEGVIGVLQAIVWPAILVYKVFELLKF